MLYWSLVFFVISMVAAFFGWGAVVGLAVAGFAKLLFFIFLFLFVLSLISGLVE